MLWFKRKDGDESLVVNKYMHCDKDEEERERIEKNHANISAGYCCCGEKSGDTKRITIWEGKDNGVTVVGGLFWAHISKGHGGGGHRRGTGRVDLR